MRGGGAAGGVSCDGCSAPVSSVPSVAGGGAWWLHRPIRPADDVASWTGFSAFPASLSYNAISAVWRDFVISVYEGGR